MNESCHICSMNDLCAGSEVARQIPSSATIYEWVMSHMNESWHIWMSHVTYEWVMSHIYESIHIWMSHVTYAVWMIHVQAVKSHDRSRHLQQHMDESCHIWMSHITYKRVMSHMNESCHIWMSHVAYERFMSHTCTSHVQAVTSQDRFRHLQQAAFTAPRSLRVAVCCSVLQCVASFHSVYQRVTACCSVVHCSAT